MLAEAAFSDLGPSLEFLGIKRLSWTPRFNCSPPSPVSKRWAMLLAVCSGGRSPVATAFGAIDKLYKSPRCCSRAIVSGIMRWPKCPCCTRNSSEPRHFC